jgi:hypothetical protein
MKQICRYIVPTYTAWLLSIQCKRLVILHLQHSRMLKTFKVLKDLDMQQKTFKILKDLATLHVV